MKTLWVVALVALSLVAFGGQLCAARAGDVDNNGIVDVFDVQLVINMALGLTEDEDDVHIPAAVDGIANEYLFPVYSEAENLTFNNDAVAEIEDSFNIRSLYSQVERDDTAIYIAVETWEQLQEMNDPVFLVSGEEMFNGILVGLDTNGSIDYYEYVVAIGSDGALFKVEEDDALTYFCPVDDFVVSGSVMEFRLPLVIDESGARFDCGDTIDYVTIAFAMTGLTKSSSSGMSGVVYDMAAGSRDISDEFGFDPEVLEQVEFHPQFTPAQWFAGRGINVDGTLWGDVSEVTYQSGAVDGLNSSYDLAEVTMSPQGEWLIIQVTGYGPLPLGRLYSDGMEGLYLLADLDVESGDGEIVGSYELFITSDVSVLKPLEMLAPLTTVVTSTADESAEVAIKVSGGGGLGLDSADTFIRLTSVRLISDHILWDEVGFSGELVGSDRYPLNWFEFPDTFSEGPTSESTETAN